MLHWLRKSCENSFVGWKMLGTFQSQLLLESFSISSQGISQPIIVCLSVIFKPYFSAFNILLVNGLKPGIVHDESVVTEKTKVLVIWWCYKSGMLKLIG